MESARYLHIDCLLGTLAVRMICRCENLLFSLSKRAKRNQYHALKVVNACSMVLVVVIYYSYCWVAIASPVDLAKHAACRLNCWLPAYHLKSTFKPVQKQNNTRLQR
jgi:hypothetical protein